MDFGRQWNVAARSSTQSYKVTKQAGGCDAPYIGRYI